MAKSNLKIYTNAVTNAKLGQSDVVLYLGETKVYPTTIPLTGATVTCGSATYTGSVQVAQSFTVTLNGTTLTKDVDYTVTQNNGGTNAGTYTVVVTGINNYEGTASGSFVINKAAATLPGTISGDRKDVHNTPARATVSKDYVGGTLQYSTNNGSSWSNVTWSSGNLTANPSNSTIGDLNVIFRVNPDSNHTAVTSSAITLTVIKATDASVTVTASSGLTYNGSAQTIATASNAHGTSAYYIGYKKDSLASSDSEVTWGSANTTPLQVTNAGDYYTYYKFTVDSQHSGDKAYTYVGQVTIAKASRTVSVPDAPTGDMHLNTSLIITPTSTGAGSEDGGMFIASSNETVARVIYDSDQDVYVLLARSAGTATITVGLGEGNNYLAASTSFTVNVVDPYNGHAYVDLGLPSGTKWATMNVGATVETASGSYYKYGDGATVYPHGQSSQYNTYYAGTENPLDMSRDTARQVWGGEWHMPTLQQITELLQNTTQTVDKSSSPYCKVFTSKIYPNRSIIIPLAGLYNYGNRSSYNAYGYIWSSTPAESPNNAMMLYFYTSGIGGIKLSARSDGCNIRPVVG